MKRILALALALVLVTACGAAAAEDRDPIVGIWYRCLTTGSGSIGLYILMIEDDGQIYETSVILLSSGATEPKFSLHGTWQPENGEYAIAHNRQWGDPRHSTAYVRGDWLFIEWQIGSYTGFTRATDDVPFAVVSRFQVEDLVRSIPR